MNWRIARKWHFATERPSRQFSKRLVPQQSEDVVEAVKCLTGTDGSVPMDIALRAELLVAGSVDPTCDIVLALKLNMTHPIEFQILTKKNRSFDRNGLRTGKIEALWNRADIRTLMNLCASRGRFLFEVRPDLFPQGFLTDAEMYLWGLYYLEKRRRK